MVHKPLVCAQVRFLPEQLGISKFDFEEESRAIRQWRAFKGESLPSGAFERMTVREYRKLRREAAQGSKRDAERFDAWCTEQRTAAFRVTATV